MKKGLLVLCFYIILISALVSCDTNDSDTVSSDKLNSKTVSASSEYKTESSIDFSSVSDENQNTSISDNSLVCEESSLKESSLTSEENSLTNEKSSLTSEEAQKLKDEILEMIEDLKFND